MEDPTGMMQTECDLLWDRASYSEVLVEGGRVLALAEHQESTPAHMRCCFDTRGASVAAEALITYIEEDTVDLLWRDGSAADGVPVAHTMPLDATVLSDGEGIAAAKEWRRRAAAAFVSGSHLHATALFVEALRHCGYREDEPEECTKLRRMCFLNLARCYHRQMERTPEPQAEKRAAAEACASAATQILRGGLPDECSGPALAIRAKARISIGKCGFQWKQNFNGAQEDLTDAARLGVEGLEADMRGLEEARAAREDADSNLYMSVAMAAQSIREQNAEAAAGEGSHSNLASNNKKAKKKNKSKNKKK